ncbi:MAG: hypothetical protein U9Q69_00545 [Nanoarchaeota archaeon]|nr:hypothetical protein [Nanoarchaeota archaeon]
MKKILLVLVLLLLISVIAVGCSDSSSDINSEEQVSEKVIGISEDIDKISTTIDDIDQGLSP